MRTLLLLRGSAGCGKSTWIAKNSLEKFTLSADNLRQLLCGESYDIQGRNFMEVTGYTEKTIWDTLFKFLEARMKRGIFTVIDACNSKTSEMKSYKDLAEKYRYRIYVVDFTDIPMETVIKQNSLRPFYKQVPEETIFKMYARFKNQGVPSGITQIKPNELDKIWCKPFNADNYKRIHHIGDIHGCYTVLQNYLDSVGGIKDDELYIFTGDYLDRGIENVEVVKFLMKIKNKPNVILLEGNHENHLTNYSHDEPIVSREFSNKTAVQLDESGISKKELRILCRKFCQAAYYIFDGKTVLVTHGGVSNIPEQMTFIPTIQMVRGVGDYDDVLTVEETFNTTAPSNYYQIHGHRNPRRSAISNGRCFNLEGEVEFGGQLRCVTLDREESFKEYYLTNQVYKPIQASGQTKEIKMTPELMKYVIEEFRQSNLVEEKHFGYISSFNFTRDAFKNRQWSDVTIKARGIFIDTGKNKITARAYDKFFNINEMEETRFDSLSSKLVFPVTAYVKENGFLGMLSYDVSSNRLFYATKSCPSTDEKGIFARWFKEDLNLSPDQEEKIKEFCKEHDCTFVFECVDIDRDPHIIDYPETRCYLLDIVKNDLNFAKFEFEDMLKVAREFSLSTKTRGYVFSNWQEFYDWYFEVQKEDYTYKGRIIEGFVIEDSNGFMTKLKLNFYTFWKRMRDIIPPTLNNGYIPNTAMLYNALANEFYAFLQSISFPATHNNIERRDVCTLRRLFYEKKNNEN